MFGGQPSLTSQVAYEWRRSWKRSPPTCLRVTSLTAVASSVEGLQRRLAG